MTDLTMFFGGRIMEGFLEPWLEKSLSLESSVSSSLEASKIKTVESSTDDAGTACEVSGGKQRLYLAFCEECVLSSQLGLKNWL